MATKKDIRRTKIKYRIRHKVSGTETTPRLTVFRSNKEIYAQNSIKYYKSSLFSLI